MDYAEWCVGLPENLQRKASPPAEPSMTMKSPEDWATHYKNQLSRGEGGDRRNAGGYTFYELVQKFPRSAIENQANFVSIAGGSEFLRTIIDRGALIYENILKIDVQSRLEGLNKGVWRSNLEQGRQGEIQKLNELLGYLIALKRFMEVLRDTQFKLDNSSTELKLKHENLSSLIQECAGEKMNTLMAKVREIIGVLQEGQPQESASQ